MRTVGRTTVAQVIQKSSMWQRQARLRLPSEKKCNGLTALALARIRKRVFPASAGSLRAYELEAH